MVGERLPWCVCRLNSDGSERWYWQRRGHKTVRLPDQPAERVAMAGRLNAAADGLTDIEGSIGWCIAQYKLSPRYARLHESTRSTYDRWLAFFEAEFGAAPAAAITRRVVMKTRGKLIQKHGAGTVLHAFAVLRQILAVAHNHDLIEHNPASKPDLEVPDSRQAFWSDADVATFLAVAPAPLALAFRLLLFTAQRPSDVVRMAWSQYDGERITVRQQKTGALVAVHVHRELKAVLDAARKAPHGPLIAVQQNRRSWTAGGLCEAIRAAMRTAGLDIKALQVRDLRRTAVVRLGQAGATVPEIAGVTGHSIRTAETILAVYLPRTAEAARNAVLKLERKADKV